MRSVLQDFTSVSWDVVRKGQDLVAGTRDPSSLLYGINQLTPVAATLVHALLLLGVAGAAILCVAMWYFWFGQRTLGRKSGLFTLLFLFAPLGTLVYYFFVYRRSQVFQAAIINLCTRCQLGIK